MSLLLLLQGPPGQSFTRFVTEQAAAADSTATTVIRVFTTRLSEASRVADSTTVTKVIERFLAEIVDAEDTISIVSAKVFAQFISETVDADDALDTSAARLFERFLSEAVAAADIVTIERILGGQTYIRELAESVGVQDSVFAIGIVVDTTIRTPARDIHLAHVIVIG